MKLKILSKVDGFRRLGMAFSSKEPTYIDVKTLSKEQIETLKSDPGLVVLETERSDEGKKDEGDVQILTAQLKEAQASLEDLTKQHGNLLKANDELKQELAAEKDAHAATKAAAKEPATKTTGKASGGK